MATRLHLRPRQHRRLRELAEAAWPHEACGLLESAGHGRIVAVHALRNVHAEPEHRFTIDPEAYLQREHAARARGHTITGIWHTHPHGDARPSPRDRDSAWPGWCYLIAGVAAGRMLELRAWSLPPGAPARPLALRIRS